MQSPFGYNSESKQTKYEIARVNTVRIEMEPTNIELLPSPKSNKDISMSEFNGRLFILPLPVYVSTEIRSNSEMEEEDCLLLFEEEQSNSISKLILKYCETGSKKTTLKIKLFSISFPTRVRFYFIKKLEVLCSQWIPCVKKRKPKEVEKRDKSLLPKSVDIGFPSFKIGSVELQSSSSKLEIKLTPNEIIAHSNVTVEIQFINFQVSDGDCVVFWGDKIITNAKVVNNKVYVQSLPGYPGEETKVFVGFNFFNSNNTTATEPAIFKHKSVDLSATCECCKSKLGEIERRLELLETFLFQQTQ